MTAHELRSLVHADETDTASQPRALHVEAAAKVLDHQVYLVLGRPQLHVEVAGAAVFRGVMQRFLQDAEEAQGDVGRDALRNVMRGKPTDALCGSVIGA